MQNTVSTIIVTAIGSFSAECVITSLKKLGIRVIGTDIYPASWHFESEICDLFEQAPLARDEEKYIGFLLRVAGENSADAIMPLTDLEIDVVNRHRERISEAGVRLLIPSPEVLSVARDKFELSRCFEGCGVVRVPRTEATWLVGKETTSLSLPCVAKPRDGRSSEGLVRARTSAEWDDIWTRKDYIIQEHIEGPVFTVDYVRDAEGNDFAVAREELIRTKNGAGTTVRITSDPVFREMTSYVGRKLGIIGCVNMEFIYDGRDYFLIDINPRFSAGVAFTALAGYDMVKAAMEAWSGAGIPEPVTVKDCIMQKKYVEVINSYE